MTIKQDYLPGHREVIYYAYYEIPDVRPHGWWPVSRWDMKDPSLNGIKNDIDHRIAKDSAYTFSREEAFSKLRELRQINGLAAVAIKKYRYYATGMPGPDGKPMKYGCSRIIHDIRFPLIEVANK